MHIYRHENEFLLSFDNYLDRLNLSVRSVLTTPSWSDLSSVLLSRILILVA